MREIRRKLEQKERLLLTLIFLAIFALLVFDLWEDLMSGVSLTHVIFEGAILLMSLLGILTQWTIFFAHKRDIRELNINLAQAQKDLENYKKETKYLTEGLSNKIDEQLTSWKLSKAEKEIALLILKGLSNREIGEIRNTSERTVRQQISSIFQKANLSSRLELSAFFLEDLLVLPQS